MGGNPQRCWRIGRSAGRIPAWLDNPGFPQSPMDLPLRLDDAVASPTTPQGPHQQVIDIKKRKKSSARAECDDATSRFGEAMFDGSGTFSGAAIRPLTLIVARREALAIAQRLVDNAFHGRAVVPPESGRLLAPYISFLGLHLARTRSAPASRRMSILSSAAKPSSRGPGLWRRSSPCRGSAGAPC